MCRADDSKMRSYGQVFWWLIVGSVGSEGVEMCQADGQKPGVHPRTSGGQESLSGTSGRRDRLQGTSGRRDGQYRTSGGRDKL